jgi:hypothetical protein
VLIGAPLELLADPTDGQAIATDTASHKHVREGLQRPRLSYARCPSFPQGRVAENVSLVCRNQDIQRHVYLALFYRCQFCCHFPHINTRLVHIYRV